MPTSRQTESTGRIPVSRPAKRAALTHRKPRLRGGAGVPGGLPAFPFYPFAHLPLLRTAPYGQRCLWRLNYPLVN